MNENENQDFTEICVAWPPLPNDLVQDAISAWFGDLAGDITKLFHVDYGMFFS